jgi:N-acetylneuraminate synthase
MSDLMVIAEIGINANGSLGDAKKLIDMAKACGADAVKFQKRDINTVYSYEYLKSDRESPFGTTQREQKEGIEFSETDYDSIDKYCKELGIFWFASAWDEKSQEFLRKYNCNFNKIASAMLTNLPFVDMVASEKRQTFVSTGMSTIADIDKVVDIFKKHKTPLTLMHAVSLYPCPDDKCNLKAINTLKKKYGSDIGYSGHELGLTPSLLAVSMGATVLERHITLDRAGYGSDQSASLERHGLEVLIREAKLIHGMMGDGSKKKVSKEEQAVKDKLVYWDKRDLRVVNV